MIFLIKKMSNTKYKQEMQFREIIRIYSLLMLLSICDIGHILRFRN